MKRYRFIKAYNAPEGTIPEGSEITTMENGAIYFNGGLVHMAYQNVLRRMIADDKIRREYLREVEIPVNKV